MHKLIFTTFFLFFFFQNGISQTEPREIKYFRYADYGSGFIKTYETGKSYDDYGNLSTKITKIYDLDGTIQNWPGGFYKYDSNNLLEQYTARRYNQEVDLWITNLWIDYKYNSNGCLEVETTTMNVGGIISRRVTYSRNTNCQITSELTEWLGNGFDLSPKDLYTRIYHADGVSYDEKLYRFSFINDSLYLTAIWKNILDENENLLELHQSILNENQDTTSHSIDIYDYDDHGNPTLSTSYFRYPNTNEWKLQRRRFYTNEYDENGFLEKKKTEQWHYDDTNPPVENLFYNQQFEYKNSCEGIQEEYQVHHAESGYDYRYEFVYEGLNKCLDIENLDLKLTVSPNPSDGYFDIFSAIFKTGNTDILVFTTDGKVLLEKKEISRCESSFIDLTSLQNGIYILQLQNGKHFVNEKIVIAN